MAIHELRAKRATTFDAFAALAAKADFDAEEDQPEYDRLKAEVEGLDGADQAGRGGAGALARDGRRRPRPGSLQRSRRGRDEPLCQRGGRQADGLRLAEEPGARRRGQDARRRRRRHPQRPPNGERGLWRDPSGDQDAGRLGRRVGRLLRAARLYPRLHRNPARQGARPRRRPARPADAARHHAAAGADLRRDRELRRPRTRGSRPPSRGPARWSRATRSSPAWCRSRTISCATPIRRSTPSCATTWSR